jgi:flagellar biosynthesis chaperone FliJ
MPDNVYTDADYDAACQAVEDAKVVLALAEREAYAAFISRYDAKVEQNRS